MAKISTRLHNICNNNIRSELIRERDLFPLHSVRTDSGVQPASVPMRVIPPPHCVSSFVQHRNNTGTAATLGSVARIVQERREREIGKWYTRSTRHLVRNPTGRSGPRVLEQPTLSVSVWPYQWLRSFCQPLSQCNFTEACGTVRC